MRSGRRAAKVIALVVYIIVILVATPQAQQQRAAYSGGPGSVAAGLAPVPPTNATTVDLLVGRSTILNVGAPISRVSLTVPDIADALVTTPNQILVHGKTPGVISLFVWDRAGGITTYEVNVRRDLSQLIDQMKQLFPGEPIVVTGSGKDVVISGTVSSKYIIDKAADVASGYVEKKENVVNLLQQQQGVASNQVLLRVRFAEVSRSALQELGATLIANGYNNQWFGRTTTEQFSSPNFDSSKPGGLTFSDFLNIFLFNSKHDIGTVIRALSSRGLFESLAEPNLIALNGKEASFLAGGEYPYPVIQAGSNNNSITIQFKEFGIRLSFTPTVLGNDLVSLHVKPEVSTLDFTNAIILDGFRVPALSTRRTETDVELADGQTFAVAGLLNNTLNNTMQKIPGIGDVPVLGYLFKSRAYQKNQTELVVMITPTIIRKGSTGVSEGLPSLIEPYMTAPPKTYQNPAPYTGSPRYPANQQPKKGSGDNEPQAHPDSQLQAPAGSPQTLQMPAGQTSSAPPAGGDHLAPQAVATQQPVMTSDPATKSLQATPATGPAPTPKELKKQQEADRKAAKEKAAADKKAADDKAVADKKQAEENAREQKLAAERDKREQEVAKKNAELDKKHQEDDKKQEKAIADAAARLKAAQAAYQAEIDKKNKDNKGGGQQQ
jgi:pilus assembly protein CpaC